MATEANTKRAATSGNGGVGNIKVAVRCRPLNETEKKSGTTLAVQCSPEQHAVKIIALNGGKRPEKRFTLDRVFGLYSRQEEIYTAMAESIVMESTQGYNCTIFAYGPTGTGKTHTMEGDTSSREGWGIIPRAAETIFEALSTKSDDFAVKISFLEIYNEELHDLLHTAGTDKRPLKLVEDLRRGVICQNLEEHAVRSTDELMQLLHKGIEARVTACTLKNQNSSRSHAIFTFRMIVKESNGEEEIVTNGQLNLVDLAGSESIGRSGARNERAKEAGSINQSLLTLGRVITTLVDKAGHVPYRDSKLTRLLQESLGGKAKTCIIATLSPSVTSVDESQSTLEYAVRARSVKNQPQMNTAVSQKVVMKEKYMEIESLRQQLLQTREKNGVYVDPQKYYAMEAQITAQAAQLQECEEALRQRDDETKQLKHEKSTLTMQLEEAQKELQDTRFLADELSQELEIVKKEVRRTFIEYRSSEAVVDEQRQTETTLFEYGTTLQQDLTACQGDVEQLLLKVQRLKDSEAQKIDDSQRFVASLQESTAALVLAAGALREKNNSCSTATTQRIKQLQENGVQTCSRLTAAVTEAVEAMNSQAQISREMMGSSCSSLKQHLSSTQEELCGRLTELKAKLQQWLTAVQNELDQKAEQELAAQSQQMVTVTQVISSHCTEVRELADKFISRQDTLNAATIRTVDDVKEDILRRLDFYRNESKEQIDVARDAITNKAQAMENAVKLMVQEMLKISNQALDAANVRATEMFTDTQRRFVTGSESVRQAQLAISDSCRNFGGQLSDKLRDTRASFDAEMKTVEQHRIALRGVVEQLSEACTAQHRATDSGIEDLQHDIGDAIRAAHTTVDETDTTAEKMVGDVRNASVRLSDSCSNSMNAFTRHLSREGEELTADVDRLATEISQQLQSQSNGINAIAAAGGDHGELIVKSELQPTATTPRAQRRTESSSVVLPRTREQQNIRNEAKEALLSDLEAQLLLFQGELNSASSSSRNSFLLRRQGNEDDRDKQETALDD